MRLAPVVGATSIAALGLVAPPARAQDFNVQGLFNGSIGFTDNVANTPSDAKPGPQADVLFAVGPGAALLLDTPRTSYRLAYVFNATLYGSHSEANSYSNTVSLGTRFETSETTNLVLGVTGEQGQLNQIAINAPAAATVIQTAAPGDNLYYRLALTEGFEKQMSEALTLRQGTGFTSYFPLGGQRAYDFENTLGATRTWERDTGGLTLGVGYTQYESTISANDQVIPTSKQLLNRAVLSWIHDYGSYFFTQLDAGVLFSLRASDGGGQIVQPLGLAAIRYVREEIETELAYAHTGTPNLQLGTNTLNDSLTLRASVPIATTYLRLSASGGVVRGRQISPEGKIGDPLDQWQADAAVSWAPLSTAGNLDVSLRYQLIDVLGDEPSNQDAFAATPAFIRSTVLLTLSVAYPDVNAATAPASESPFRPPPQGSEDPLREQRTPSGPRTPGGPGAPRSPSSQ